MEGQYGLYKNREALAPLDLSAYDMPCDSVIEIDDNLIKQSNTLLKQSQWD